MKIIKSFIYCNIQVEIKKNYMIGFQLFNPILFLIYKKKKNMIIRILKILA